MVMDFFRQIDHIAPELDHIHASADAVPGYDVLADALVWSDEYPSEMSGCTTTFDCVKLLLRFRTTLLLGQPDHTLKPYWDRGLDLSPNWAGFSTARVTPSKELSDLYFHYSQRAMRKLERYNKVCQRAVGTDKMGNK